MNTSSPPSIRLLAIAVAVFLFYQPEPAPAQTIDDLGGKWTTDESPDKPFNALSHNGWLFIHSPDPSLGWTTAAIRSQGGNRLQMSMKNYGVFAREIKGTIASRDLIRWESGRVWKRVPPPAKPVKPKTGIDALTGWWTNEKIPDKPFEVTINDGWFRVTSPDPAFGWTSADGRFIGEKEVQLAIMKGNQLIKSITGTVVSPEKIAWESGHSWQRLPEPKPDPAVAVMAGKWRNQLKQEIDIRVQNDWFFADASGPVAGWTTIEGRALDDGRIQMTMKNNGRFVSAIEGTFVSEHEIDWGSHGKWTRVPGVHSMAGKWKNERNQEIDVRVTDGWFFADSTNPGFGWTTVEGRSLGDSRIQMTMKNNGRFVSAVEGRLLSHDKIAWDKGGGTWNRIKTSGPGSLTSRPGTPEHTVRQYIACIYGDKTVDIAKICHPHPDLWMIAGAPNPQAVAMAKTTPLKVTDPGVASGLIGQDIFFTEIRRGKIDPAFTLDGVYNTQKRLVLEFLYASLLQEERTLENLVTNVKNIDFGGAPKAGYGDMDVYGGILSLLPVLRSSDPATDAKSKTVTYRTPLGEKGFELTLIKQGSTWKIDSRKKISVPLEFFWR